MGYPIAEKKVDRKRYIQLRKLSEELYDWLKLHKVDYKKGECCVLKTLTMELLERE
jgi:hypothetical protein